MLKIKNSMTDKRFKTAPFFPPLLVISLRLTKIAKKNLFWKTLIYNYKTQMHKLKQLFIKIKLKSIKKKRQKYLFINNL